MEIRVSTESTCLNSKKQRYFHLFSRCGGRSKFLIKCLLLYNAGTWFTVDIVSVFITNAK